MNELHLFAGAGGGILAGQLLGNRCVCAVEWEPYAQAVLVARQNDGTFPPFPIWPDVQTFDGRPWNGIADVVAGGFPCQDISVAGGGQALTENAAECGTTWPASFAKYDPSSHTLKTAQLSLLEDLTACCATLPASGLMRDGECWELPTLAPHTSVTASGFLPTPTATDANGRTYYYSNGKKDGAVPSLCGVAKLLPTPAASDWKGVYTWETVKRRMQMTRGVLLPEELCRQAGKAITPNPEFWEWMMGWPIGSTGLKPLETDRFQEWQQQHSIY